MAIQRSKIALNNARLPLISTEAQRAVFVPGLDSAPRIGRNFSGAAATQDFNIPQVIFSENVMPTSYGIASTGYWELIAATANTDFDSVFVLKDEDENSVLYSPAGGKNYVYDAGAWGGTDLEGVYGAFFVSFNKDPATCRVTYCYVEGVTFVCFSELTVTLNTGGPDYTIDGSIYWWNPAVKRLEAALNTKYSDLPFADGTVAGVGSSNGHLLVFSGLEIAWAPFNGTVFDFTPYDNNAFTGAGVQTPEDVQGNIQALISLPGGFLAFTDKNCIAATYTSQNLSSVWIFREVAGAGGIESYEQATVEGSLGVCYALTTSGVQRISLNQSESIFPEVSDFIAGRYIERIELGDLSRIEGSTTLDLFTKLTAVGNRYLVVSYGTMQARFTHALVYDIGLERWGKLAVRHRDCFYYNYGTTTGDYTYIMVPEPYDSPLLSTYAATTGISSGSVSAQHALAFLQDTGEVVIADWSKMQRDAQDEAVAMIGRIQLTRTSNVQFNRAELDGFRSGTVHVSVSTDGGDIQPAVPLVPISQSQQTAVFGEMLDGKNITLIVTGTFQLSTVILETTNAGTI